MTRPSRGGADAISCEDVLIRSAGFQLYAALRWHRPHAPTILLLQGLGFHSFEYDGLAPILAAGGFNSLALDFRGHGRSAGPRGGWLLRDLVADAGAAVEYLIRRAAGPIGIYGNSLGALVGLYVASRDHRVRSLVASSCPTRVADFAVTPFRRALLKAMQWMDAVVPLRISVNHFIPYRRILQDPRVITRVSRDPRITDARRFRPATYADMFAWNALDVIDALQAPLLVLYAAHDGLQPLDQSFRLYAAAQGPKEIMGLDTGHVPNLENPDLLGPILQDWFGRTLCLQEQREVSRTERADDRPT